MEVVPGLHWVERIWDTKVYVWEEGEQVIVIDAATPGRARAVWEFLGKLGHPRAAIDQIWLTHGDIDHMGSVAAIKDGSGARVVAHRADAPLVDGQADRELGDMPLAGAYQRLVNWTIRHAIRYTPASVDRLVEDGDALGAWQVVHVPGHTAGSVCFYHPECKIAIVGDALNHRRGQLGAPPRMFTPDMKQAHASVHKLAELDIEVCCFGHGPPLVVDTGERLRAFADSL